MIARQDTVLARRQDQLDTELRRFIDFGVLLDRRTRRYLAEIIRHRAFGEATPDLPPLLQEEDATESLDATYTRYLADALDRLFADDALVAICQKQGALGTQVATETLRWMRRTLHTLDSTDPHADERARLRQVAGLPLPRFIATHRTVLNELENDYAAHELDSSFYRTALAACADPSRPHAVSADQAERVELLLHDLLAAWDALLSAKRLESQLGALVEARERFTTRMHERIDEHRRVQQLLTPFVDYLDRGWDLSRELWDEADLDLLAEYAALLEQEDDLRRLADLLGRMHDAELQTDEEELIRTIDHRRWVEDPMLRSEIVGVRTSDDLSNMLSIEAAMAGDPVLEDRFLQKLADKRLQTFAFGGQRQISDPEVRHESRSRSRRRAKGPFILCVDTSYSMAGEAERLAKVLAFGILRIAIEEDREAYLINFSVQIRTLDLRQVGQNIDTLAAFLRQSFHGGTDVTLAFGKALEMLEDKRYTDADVLVVSDFIMLRMSRSVLDDVQSHQHNHGTRFHALTFQDHPSRTITDCFDTVWASSPDAPGVIAQLAHRTREIRQAGVG